MKSKLCLFLIMFLIWCLFNGCTVWLLEKLRVIDSDSSYSPVYFFTAFAFSAMAAIWPEDFKFTLIFILLAELCWLIILSIQGNENSFGYVLITMFNNSFFVLGGYLSSVGAFWYGYWSGKLGLSLGLGLLVGEMIFIGLSIILALAIHKLSIRVTKIWIGEDAAPAAATFHRL
jgi:hypothetical protein